MTDKDELELRLATTLAPMLLTVATFSLATVTGIASVIPLEKTILNEVFSVIAAFSVFSAALLADSALHKQKLTWLERIPFIGGGYLCFCLAVSALTSVIPMLYAALRSPTVSLSVHSPTVPAVCAGIFAFLKVMSHQDKNAWTIGMILSYGAVIYVLTL